MVLGLLPVKAQLQQGYFVVRTADGQTVTLKDSDIANITFDTQKPVALDNMWYIIGFDIGDGSWNIGAVPVGRMPMYVQDVENAVFTYTAYFTGGGFKLVGESWDRQWGALGGGYVKNNGGSANICVDSPGFYTVTLQSHDDWLQIQPFVGEVASYGSISIIGDFNAWSADVDMTLLPGQNSHNWYCQLTLTSDTGLKFRADHDWTVNWGNDIFPSTQGLRNGGNIPVKAGTYTVLFNDLTGYYHFYDPSNPTANSYTMLTFEGDLNVTPVTTRVEFETYAEPTVQLFTDASLPLTVDYTATYSMELRYQNRSYTLSPVWYSENDSNFGQVTVTELAAAVQSLCGKASVERQLDVVVTANVEVKGFPEVYTATLPLTCLPVPSPYDEFVCFIGSTDGWAKAEQRLRSPQSDGVYTGYVYCADPNGWGNQFQLQTRPTDWDCALGSDAFVSILGDFAAGNGNIVANAGEGVYYVTLDLNAMTIEGTRIYNMNLVGSNNGWNPADDSQQMTWNAVEQCYEYSGAAITTADWKFTANNTWDINLGGTPDNLEANGSNIVSGGSIIRLYPTRRSSDNIYFTAE